MSATGATRLTRVTWCKQRPKTPWERTITSFATPSSTGHLIAIHSHWLQTDPLCGAVSAYYPLFRGNTVQRIEEDKVIWVYKYSIVISLNHWKTLTFICNCNLYREKVRSHGNFSADLLLCALSADTYYSREHSLNGLTPLKLLPSRKWVSKNSFSLSQIDLLCAVWIVNWKSS